MRILENNDIIEIICIRCNSKLGIEANDVRYNEIAHHCSTFEITCPCCNKTNGVSSIQIPHRWYSIIGVED